MYKEMNGKMELHVSHELSIRSNMEREFAIKDYTMAGQRPAHGVHQAQ